MLVASWSDTRGEAGTGSGITLGPGVLLRRSSGDIFVRAMVPLGTLLSELEEFCSTSPKTLSLLLKHWGPGVLPLASLSSPNATAGAVLVGEWEPPSPPSLQQGRSGHPPFLGRPPPKWRKRLFCRRKTLPCPGFLGRSWTGAVPCVTSCRGWEELHDSSHLIQGLEEDARGAAKVWRERP